MLDKFIFTCKLWLNKLFGVLSNPEDVLKEQIETMRDQVVKLNGVLATTYGNLILFKGQKERLERGNRVLEQRIKLAAEKGYDSVGLQLSEELVANRKRLVDLEEQIPAAEKSVADVKELRQAYITRMKAEVAKLEKLISSYKLSEVQASIADLSSEYSTKSSRNEKAYQDLEKKIAYNQGKQAMTVGSNEMAVYKLEREEVLSQAQEEYNKFKLLNKGKNAKSKKVSAK